MPSHLMSVCNPAPAVPVREEGVWLHDAAGAARPDCIGGVATNAPGHPHRVGAREQNLLVPGRGDNCVRLLPPLIEEADEIVRRLASTCEAMETRLAEVA